MTSLGPGKCGKTQSHEKSALMDYPQRSHKRLFTRGGSVNHPLCRIGLTIQNFEDERNNTYTVTGYDLDGDVITEEIKGTNGTLSMGEKVFKSITSLTRVTRRHVQNKLDRDINSANAKHIAKQNCLSC